MEDHSSTAGRPLRPALERRTIATAMRGVYLVAAPPADFDPRTATAEMLARQGFHWKRPQAGDDAALAAAWDAHFSHAWSPSKRLQPRFAVQRGKTHRPIRRRMPGKVADEITNWAGGVLAGTWTSASGTWVVPTVSKPTEVAGSDGGWDSSSWVGLDGSGSNDVLQAGVQQSVDAKGNATYIAWYEWFCNFQKQTLGLGAHQN